MVSRQGLQWGPGDVSKLVPIWKAALEPCGHPQPGSWCGLAQNRIPLVLAWTHLQVQETLKPSGDNPFIFVHIHDEFMIKHKSLSSSEIASLKKSLCSCAATVYLLLILIFVVFLLFLLFFK